MEPNSSESSWISELDRLRANRINIDRILPIDQTDSIESIALETKSKFQLYNNGANNPTRRKAYRDGR